MLEDKYTELLLTRIRSGKTDRDKVIEELYYHKELQIKVRTLLFKKGGNESDFDMVFNTSLMQFIKTVVKNKDFTIKASLTNYIVGIAKYVWYKECNIKSKNIVEEIDQQFSISSEITPESIIIDHSQKDLIKKLLSKVGDKCKEVLMYWANGYKMKEIADLVGYKSEGMAKKKKHQCFHNLLSYVENNPHIKSILR